jgi:hypothetical protein
MTSLSRPLWPFGRDKPVFPFVDADGKRAEVENQLAVHLTLQVPESIPIKWTSLYVAVHFRQDRL